MQKTGETLECLTFGLPELVITSSSWFQEGAGGNMFLIRSW